MAVLSKYTSLPLAEAVKIHFGIRYYCPRHRRSRKSRVAAPHRTVLSHRRRRPYGSAQKAQVGDGMSRRRDIKRAAPMVHFRRATSSKIAAQPRSGGDVQQVRAGRRAEIETGDVTAGIARIALEPKRVGRAWHAPAPFGRHPPTRHDLALAGVGDYDELTVQRAADAGQLDADARTPCLGLDSDLGGDRVGVVGRLQDLRAGGRGGGPPGGPPPRPPPAARPGAPGPPP